MMMVHQGLLRASLLVRNQTAMRRAAPLLVRQAASIMQNMRKTTVLLPKVACVTWAALRPGTVMSAKIIAMLGQPVPQVRNSMMAPTRIPRTWNPAWLRPSGGGIIPVPKRHTAPASRAIHLKAEVLVCAIVFFSPL